MKLAIRSLLLFSIILCCFTGAVVYSAYLEKREAQYWVDHTYQVLEEAGEIGILYKDIELSYQRFSTNNDSSFFQAFTNKQEQLKGCIEKLNALISDNPEQVRALKREVAPQIYRRLSEIDKSYRSGGSFKGAAFDQGSSDAIQKSLSNVILRERQLLATRYSYLLGITTFTEWLVYGSLSLICGSIVWAGITISRIEKHNSVLVTSLETLNNMLEEKVNLQTRDLQVSNNELQVRNNELAAINEELRASEEEVKANLEFISLLKNDLERSEQLHRALTENSQDIIAVFSLENRFVYVSPAIEAILGYKPEEVLGMLGSELMHPEDLSKVNTPDTFAFKGPSPKSPHFRLRHKNGTYIWIESLSNAIVNEAGQTTSIQTINRDITERKRAEADLQDAKKKAEEATLAKSQFLSTMSHEIRTPMNAVIGLTNLLLDQEPRVDQVESLKLLKFSGQGLLTIINDILDFSKIEAGKIQIEKITFNLHELVSNIVSVHSNSAHQKGIALRLNYSQDTPHTFEGDPVRIGQVITNLVSNAIKFTSKGQVDLTVSSRNRFPSEITMAVQDSGIGMDLSQQKHVFESFSQASSDTTRKYGGTGLGLAISKKLAELLGGSIQLESSPGHGSTFTFTIPLQSTTAPDNLIVSKEIFTINRKIKVLLVEDNRVNQIVAESFLKRWGIMVDTASNGDEAMSLLASKGYNLILMDLQMPEKDGFTTTKEIRNLSDQYFKTIPIIALTAAAMSEIRDEVYRSGMNGYISKPFDPDELKDKLIGLLQVPYQDVPLQRKPWTEAFNMYTEGNVTLKREMAALLIGNIEELSAVAKKLRTSPESKDAFNAAVHKSKTTLKFVGDKEYESIIESIKSTDFAIASDSTHQLFETFELITEKLLTGLKEEIQ